MSDIIYTVTATELAGLLGATARAAAAKARRQAVEDARFGATRQPATAAVAAMREAQPSEAAWDAFERDLDRLAGVRS